VNKKLERIVAACLWVLAGGIVAAEGCIMHDIITMSKTLRLDIMDDAPLRPPCPKPMDLEDCPRPPD